jgi:myo-inositol-1(or 4)-monophosphatase
LPASDLNDALRYRDLLVTAVRDGGTLALKAFRAEQKSWFKGAGKGSPVSESDLAVNALLHDRLRPATPDFGWLSEESADDPARLDQDVAWVVDPIDGTRAYLGGREDWTVSVALVQGGRPVLAALYAPATDEMFTAVAGQGAFVNDRRMAASPGGLAGTRAAGPQHPLKALLAEVPDAVAEPRIHSLALRFARVAQGRIDAAFAGSNSHDWDLAAADLLVHETGGAMTNFAGEPVIYNRAQPVHAALVAAGRDRHAALIRLIAERPSVFV